MGCTDKREDKQVMDELERFFSVNHDLFCITDHQGRFVRVNSSWKSILGYSRDDLREESFGGLCHSEDAFSPDRLQEFSNKDKAVTHINRFRHIDGSYCLIEWRSQLFGNLLYSSGRDITDRKNMDDALINYSEIQHILMNIAMKYINIQPEEVDVAINEALRELGEFVDADRVYIFDYNFEKNITINRYEWCGYGIPPQIRNLQSVDLDIIPSWVEKHKKGLSQYIHDVSSLPQEDGMKIFLEDQEIKSILTFPMMEEGVCVGFVGFDSVMKNHCYSDDEASLLQFFAQIVLNMRSRVKAYLKVKDFADRMEQKTLQLDLALQQSENASQSKSEFLANMSHEIRTPLNGVIGYTELLSEVNMDPQHKRYVDNARNSALTLVDIVNDILDLSKIEAGKLELDEKKIDVLELLRQTAAVVKVNAAKKGVKLYLNYRPEVPRFIYADSYRLKQVFINLLGNAVKFTAEGEIELKLDFSSSGHLQGIGEFSFSVRDTGIGITEEQQKRIFEAFSQGDSSTTRKFGGTGLGLVITRKLLGKMGSELWLESIPGKGTTFSFALTRKYWKDNPLPATDSISGNVNDYSCRSADKSALYVKENNCNNADGNVLNSDAGQSPSGGNGTMGDKTCGSPVHDSENSVRPEENIRDCEPLILIAEDVMVNMELARLMIRKIMPEVRFISAVNGEEAVRAFRENKPDLVLMDIHMPVKDGYSAAAEIRDYSSALGKHVPVIALTARALDGERQRCIQSGMVDIITKPVEIGALRNVLLKYFDGDKVKDGPPVVQDNENQDIKGKSFSPPTSIDKIRTSLFLKEDRKIVRFINMALPALRDEMGCLEQAVNKGDFENIEAAAHKIRGLALNFSCEKLASLAEKLESMKPGFSEELKVLLENTGKEVIRVEEAFNGILESIKRKEYNGIK